MAQRRDTHERCGLVRTINGRDWVCIKEAHDDPPREGHGQRSMQWYRGYAPKSERHWFVPRYSDLHLSHPTD